MPPRPADAAGSSCPSPHRAPRCAAPAAPSGARCAYAAPAHPPARPHTGRRWPEAPGSAGRDRRAAAAPARGAGSRSCARLGLCGLGGAWLRPQPERVTDCVAEFGAIERVEVELADAVRAQLVYLFDRDAGGDQASRLGIVLQALETLAQRLRNAGTAALGEAAHLR